MDKKIERFLELSFKFSKNAYELFPEYSQPIYNTCTSENSDAVEFLLSAMQVKPLQRPVSEKIMIEARNKAELAEEFEEYIKLQKELQDYYQALNKLNN